MSATPRSSRLDIIDAARGIAVVAMVAYHGLWDLVTFDLAHVDLFRDPFWLGARTAILGSFLFLAGLGQVLSRSRGFNRRRFLKRLGFLVLAALAVTAASLPLFPDSPIFFGVLHHMAVASLLGLAFVRAPWWLTGVIGVAVIAAGGHLSAPFFDQPVLQWLGLMTYAPRSNDYVPIVPWFGIVLLGIAAGTLWPRNDLLARWQAAGRLAKGVVKMGRYSLIIYLVHQPILFGGLWLVMQTVPPAAVTVDAFVTSCRPTCEATGKSAEDCQRSCSCAGDRLNQDHLLDALTAPDKLTAEQRRKLRDTVEACR